MSIGIIGTGAYGLSIALSISKTYNIKMWVESEDRAKFIDNNRKNSGILPNIEIPNNISFSNDYEYVLNDSNVIFIAVSTQYVKDVSKNISKYSIKNKHFCILSKGIEQGSCSFLTEVFKKYVKTKNISIISGPSFAIDLAHHEPIGLSIASKNKNTINEVKRVLSNDKLKLRETKDIIGIEICGSIKNIIAIASGIVTGLGYNESTRSFLITESIHDIKELIYGLGGNKKTVLSYAGIGDLLLTATSTKSRNYSYGYLVGKKTKGEAEKFLEENTVEGYYTLKSIHKLINKKNIHIPIINIIYNILFKNENPENLINFLIKK